MTALSWFVMKGVFAVVYLSFLILCTVRKRPGFATWHMFSRASSCRFDLTFLDADGVGRPFNPWLYVPHSHISMNSEELPFFLAYLKLIRGLSLTGSVHCEDVDGKRVITLNSGRVVG